MNFKLWLNEMHYEDIYPEEFKLFRKEWGKIGRSNDSSYYVQFSNHKSDPLDRVGNRNPDHHDPVGDYAYPLKYVINHPADIWYGRTAKWLRVLKDKSRNKLNIKDLNKAHAHYLLHKMGIPDHLDLAMKKLPNKRISSAIGKAFFMAVQNDYSVPVTRSSEMQARLLLRAGIDAIEDVSGHQSAAAINDREPEQIMFLHRSAFEVVKVYRLSQGSTHNLAGFSPETKHERKLVSALLEGMDDKIVTNKNGYYWSQKGRRIRVEFRSVKSTHDRKLGEKKHKEFKLHDHFAISIDIDHSEKGTIHGKYAADDKFEYIIQDMLRKWRAAKETGGYQPDTMQAHAQRQDAENKAWMEKERAERERQADTNEKELVPVLQELGSRLGVIFRPIPGRDYRYSDIIQSISRGLKRGGDITSFWIKQAQDYERMEKLGEGDYAIGLGYIPANVGNSFHPDLAQLRDLINVVHQQQPIDGPWVFPYLLQTLKSREEHGGI